MSIFALDNTFVFELAVIAAGLITLHRAGKESPANLLRAAGLILFLGGLSTMVCTVYYGLKYSRQGDFDHDSGALAKSCPMMKAGGMMDSMKPDRMMPEGQ